MLDGTRSLACEVKSARKQVTTGTPKQSGIPCTMVYGLIRDLPGVRALIATVVPQTSLAELDLGVGRSGPHGFTVRIARFVLRTKASIASRSQRP